MAYQDKVNALWFAWKIVLLQYRKQLVCCSSVSFFVVICLKNRTFAVSQTTIAELSSAPTWLWFAWKIVLLQYRKQRGGRHSFRDRVVICLKNRTFAVSQTTNYKWKVDKYGCDLLEKSYFCSIANNDKYFPKDDGLLWFAWKIVLLQYRKQLNILRNLLLVGCDLLEKSYFCSIANNILPRRWRRSRVVICLKNRTFAVSQTTGC